MANKKKQAQKKSENGENYIVTTLTKACIYYTVMTFLLIFLFWLITGDITRVMHPVALMLIFPFSLLFSTANTIFRAARLDTWVKVICHYTMTMLGMMLCLYLPNKAPDATAMGAFALFLVFTVVYFIIMAVVLYLRARLFKIERDEKAYTSVYKK